MFENEDAVTSHLTQSEACELSTLEIPDGVTPDIVEKLRNKKTEQRTEAQRWQEIYKLLFPNEMIPSPCESPRRVPVQCQFKNTIQSLGQDHALGRPHLTSESIY